MFEYFFWLSMFFSTNFFFFFCRVKLHAIFARVKLMHYIFLSWTCNSKYIWNDTKLNIIAHCKWTTLVLRTSGWFQFICIQAKILHILVSHPHHPAARHSLHSHSPSTLRRTCQKQQRLLMLHCVSHLHKVNHWLVKMSSRASLSEVFQQDLKHTCQQYVLF